MPESENMWNAMEHSDDDNVRWCWLRAVEWGNWPTFISQPIVPVALLFLPWKMVIGAAVGSNILWAILVRYQVVIPSLAFLGLFLVRLKWFACPAAAYILYKHGTVGVAALALLWPVAMFIPGVMIPVQIGKIQKMFMYRLGYGQPEENPNPDSR